ncbi:MAG: ABC transporter ATP-binding protein [Lachnospiraceae bacterium]|nr:ABC transporter ATP-binding protein [Lachnospiraceae bacterium]
MITVEHLTKCYGDFMAVRDLSFEIDEGHVYGFLGPNGAGKSTTMNIMTGCLSATEGRVLVDGYDIFEEPEKAKRLIGYLPEQPPLYMNETPAEYLKFVGEAKGLRGRELRRQMEEVMEQTRIEQVQHRLISNLSKGYRQRVGIAQALLGNPKVIILDEPTVGLDPLQIIEIRDLIKQLGENHTVILSSHILSEVQAICEKVLIIAKGRLLAFDAPENLEKLMLASHGILLTTEASKEETEEILGQIEEIADWELKEKPEEGVTAVEVRVESDDARALCRRLFFAFAQKERAILTMNVRKANLEDVFIELTEGEPDEEAPVPETETDTETAKIDRETGGESRKEEEKAAEGEVEER